MQKAPRPGAALEGKAFEVMIIHISGKKIYITLMGSKEGKS